MGRIKKEKCTEFHGESICEVLGSRYNAHTIHMGDLKLSYKICRQNVKKSDVILTFPDVFFNLVTPVKNVENGALHLEIQNNFVANFPARCFRPRSRKWSRSIDRFLAEI